MTKTSDVAENARDCPCCLEMFLRVKVGHLSRYEYVHTLHMKHFLVLHLKRPQPVRLQPRLFLAPSRRYYLAARHSRRRT